jgi:hypothetical protein
MASFFVRTAAREPIAAAKMGGAKEPGTDLHGFAFPLLEVFDAARKTLVMGWRAVVMLR